MPSDPSPSRLGSPSPPGQQRLDGDVLEDVAAAHDHDSAVGAQRDVHGGVVAAAVVDGAHAVAVEAGVGRTVRVELQHDQVGVSGGARGRPAGDHDPAVGLQGYGLGGVDASQVDPERPLGVEAGVTLAAGQQRLDGDVGEAVALPDRHDAPVGPKGDVERAVIAPAVVDDPRTVTVEAGVEVARDAGRHARCEPDGAERRERTGRPSARRPDPSPALRTPVNSPAL
jgi:hypothetical protein